MIVLDPAFRCTICIFNDCNLYSFIHKSIMKQCNRVFSNKKKTILAQSYGSPGWIVKQSLTPDLCLLRDRPKTLCYHGFDYGLLE